MFTCYTAEWFGFESFEAPSEVKAGETLKVICSVWGDSFLKIHGYIQHLNTTTSSSQVNNRVTYSEEVLDFSHKKFTLSVRNTTEADSGMYRCAAFSVKLFLTLWSEPVQVSIV